MTVVLRVRLRCLGRMMRGMRMVTVGAVGMVGSLLMCSRLMVPGSFIMVPRSLLVVFGGVAMMFSCGLRHGALLSVAFERARPQTSGLRTGSLHPDCNAGLTYR